ncbi:acyl-CoA synthetase (NDP forming) [Caldisphaera lagunensis DSM 15908]|uniref:Acyl-CoA synthetase (NDP forming) n=1 Tax=Caldisphaera lagunensis (strain DSM 15908 / JCM 11604 / ANMR 0165 / IC-154) TaxID=1056495 RepID=L0ABU5_CALLD|nr:acetate--CoA ligase family protein [Caldisphaera lagunensis]AFZ70904.1 acyl-CoA synthetase (NDP forming) [Caldisphaera lagunensis DSM 15908]
MEKNSIKVFFEPNSVAIIGASPKKENLGRIILDSMQKNYKGRLYVINPNYDEVQGVKSYKSILDIDDEIDIAVIAVDAKKVPDLMLDAGKKGVKGVVIVSGGFAEIDSELGYKLQEEIIEIANKFNMRILGPNCIGIYNSFKGVDTFFLPYERMRRPKSGAISIISQSGALLATLMDWAASKNIGIGKAINFGNKADIDEIDSLEYLGKDEETRVILMYIEGITPGKGYQFVETARKVTSVYRKPIILIKGGKTSRGASAAKSHTASLAGSYEIFKAISKQANIIIANDLEELFDIAKVMSFNLIPKGNRVGIITNSGGHGVIAADTLIENGLSVPEISEKIKEKLKEVFPPRVSLHNPIDFTGDAKSDYYKYVLDLLSENDEVDMFLIIALIQPQTMDLSISNVIFDFSQKHFDKPIAVVTIGAEMGEKLKLMLEEKGVPVFEFPDRASKALAKLYDCRKCSTKRFENCRRISISQESINRAREIIKNALYQNRNKLLENEALDLLNVIGVNTVKYCIVENYDMIKSCIKEINFPVAMKIISEGIIHKSDVGGVILNINNEEELAESYKNIIKNVKYRLPQAKISGVMIQEMAKQGNEIIVGSKFDENFGPIVLFGLGGIYTEVIGDVSMRMSPITDCDAREMIDEIKSVKILEGYRGLEPVDKNAVAEAIMRVGELMLAIPEISEMDINPLIASSLGVKAVDARVILKR